MKSKNIIMLVLLLAPAFLFGQIMQVKTDIKTAKVYLNGAQLTHTAKLKLEKGTTDILFENIAQDFDVNSVSVSGKGGFIITSIGQQFDYLKTSFKPSDVKIIEDSLEILKTDIANKQNDKAILSEEEDLIIKNGAPANRQTAVSIAEVQKYADYMKKRVGEIKKSYLTLDKDIEKSRKRIENLNKQLAELNAKYNQPVNQINVTVIADAPTNAEFEITYFVAGASWVPQYEVRVPDVNKPIKLNYTAMVTQNTGLNWKDVKIILSSGAPEVSQVKPELSTDYVDFARPAVMKKAASYDKSLNLMEEKSEMVTAMQPAQTLSDFTEVSENMLSFEFESTILYNIPADGRPHMVNLKDYELQSTYEYYAAPKLDKNAFLVGHITNWNTYNFLPGEASTYFQNTYIGKSVIDPTTSGDTLTISLGRDKGIDITREAIKDYTEDKFLSSDIERTFAFNVKIKNNKNQKVKLLVEDQIPVSKNEDIKVKLIESSGAVYTEDSGSLKWYVTVDPGKSVTKKLVFSVRHPKDKAVTGL